MNEISFVAGDNILFKRGGVWNGNLKPKGSGKKGQSNGGGGGGGRRKKKKKKTGGRRI